MSSILVLFLCTNIYFHKYLFFAPTGPRHSNAFISAPSLSKRSNIFKASGIWDIQSIAGRSYWRHYYCVCLRLSWERRLGVDRTRVEYLLRGSIRLQTTWCFHHTTLTLMWVDGSLDLICWHVLFQPILTNTTINQSSSFKKLMNAVMGDTEFW